MLGLDLGQRAILGGRFLTMLFFGIGLGIAGRVMARLFVAHCMVFAMVCDRLAVVLRRIGMIFGMRILRGRGMISVRFVRRFRSVMRLLCTTLGRCRVVAFSRGSRMVGFGRGGGVLAILGGRMDLL